MQGQIGKWGNSLALRIPSAVAREVAVADGESVDIAVDSGRIVITPIDSAPRYSLDELLAGMTKENLHGEVSTGAALGNEEL